VALLARRHDRARPYISAILRRAGLLTCEGHEAIPREGPLLLLSNHVEFPDAITMNEWDGIVTARSSHPGGVSTLMGDGSVRFVSQGISRRIWRGLGTRNGDELIE
jgi:prepilin-type processing-associated H-X9-DG protein